MTPDEYRDGMLRAVEDLRRTVSLLLGLLPASPSDEQWQAFLDAVYPEVLAARRRCFELSREFYASERHRYEDSDDAPRVQERPYSERALDDTLTKTTRARLEGLDELEADRELIEQETLATLERHSLAAGRDAVVDAARNDPKALGYARVPSGAETCSFCTMLVSRGPVYKTRTGALFREGSREPYHNRCDCVAVPVFRKDDWPGREEYLAAEELWKQSTKGKSGAQALNALRQTIEGRAETPTQ